jgi:SpoU rRNA methylase family enzyme
MNLNTSLLIIAALTSTLAVQDGSFLLAAQAREYQETRVDVDEQAGTIRFIVSGVERAQLNSSGLHVYGDITYTGVSRDAGHDVPHPRGPQGELEGKSNE